MTMASDLGLSLDQIKAGLELLKQPRVIRRKGREVMLPPRLIDEDGRLFEVEIYRAERNIATHIRRLQAAQLDPIDLPATAFGGVAPDDSQLAAVREAMRANVFVLTGGPGVGKTTVAKAIITAYESAGLKVLGCAPTGKAAQRMKQQTGRPAGTIHNTIGLVPGKEPRHDDGPRQYAASGAWLRGGPLEVGAVIVDEASMVDVSLMAELLCAIPSGARLLIIGDVDQLPSIGAGRVLFDLIASQAVPCARLLKIHRQASESRIPYVARDINEGRVPDLTPTGTDYTHWQTSSEAEAADRIIRAITDSDGSISNRKGIAVKDVQVLAAQYAGPCGVVELNNRLQAALNPTPNNDRNGDIFIGSKKAKYGAHHGDRVIQTSNNYDLLVMNGEMGYVVAASPDGIEISDETDLAKLVWSGKTKDSDDGSDAGGDDVADFGNEEILDDDGSLSRLDALEAKAAKYGGLSVVIEDGTAVLKFVTPRVLVVDFGDRKIAYSKEEARELDLGYAITVHRSQGSQFKAVVVATFCQNSFMLTRALLYTAITRAESFCLTVGTADQLGRAARNTRGTDRRTALQERLSQSELGYSESFRALTPEK